MQNIKTGLESSQTENSAQSINTKIIKDEISNILTVSFTRSSGAFTAIILNAINVPGAFVLKLNGKKSGIYLAVTSLRIVHLSSDHLQ